MFPPISRLYVAQNVVRTQRFVVCVQNLSVSAVCPLPSLISSYQCCCILTLVTKPRLPHFAELPCLSKTSTLVVMTLTPYECKTLSRPRSCRSCRVRSCHCMIARVRGLPFVINSILVAPSSLQLFIPGGKTCPHRCLEPVVMKFAL